MSKRAHGAIDIEELVSRIRREAAEMPEILPQPVTLRASGAPPAALRVPGDPLRGFQVKDAYHAGELLLYDGEDFVSVAYRAILRREADAEGMRIYAGKLRAGASKVLVLCALAASAEGRSQGVRVIGLRAARLAYLLQASLARLHLARLARPLFDSLAGSLERRVEPLRGPFALLLRNQREAVRFAETASDAAAEQAEALRRFSAEQQRVSAESTAALQRVSVELTAALRRVSAEHGAALESIGADLRVQRRDLLSQQAGLAGLADRVSTGGATRQGAGVGGQETRPAAAADERIAAYYVAFEDSFRGESSEVRDKLSVYLPRFEPLRESSALRPVLDVGCGRGEWLALLAGNGINAYGVDTNALMAADCRGRGLVVHQADVLEHLHGLSEQSLSAITGFHIVEHLPFETLFALFGEAWRTLAEGGLILFETPNPENVVVASHAFYNDFSHRNPVTPTGIGFLARYHNFERIEIVRLHPYPREQWLKGNDPVTELLNYHFCGPQDYALVARKPRLDSAV